MKETEKIKEVVREKYSLIANGESGSCCGGSSCCGGDSYTVFSDDYGTREGHVEDADLGLGCGIPTDFADIKPGEHILDLGSGAGNDCFVARGILGAKGSVTGLDFTEAMIKKARENNEKMGYDNVAFVQGDIDAMPFGDEQFDLIISNCVLNLVPDKSKAFSEIFRGPEKGRKDCCFRCGTVRRTS
ncbi:MAG: methyltransferase domain-containing protein [Marinilabiliales bacterium]|nr:methyltransferase domain-containing protein [Marinilabiliales bacterium]